MEPIKPCPFCGDEGKLFNDMSVLFVRCRLCGARGPKAYSPVAHKIMENRNVSFEEACMIRDSIGIERAIKKWNDRA